MRHQVNRKRFSVAGVLLVTVGLSGCELLGLSDTPQPATPPPAQTEAPPPKPVEEPPPKPKAVPGEEYQRPDYPNMTRRNPFQPDLDVIKPAAVAAEAAEEKLEPLERFALGELELVAIISEVAVPKAMFIDPEGFGHVLKEGDRIGRNRGILSDIRDNEVEVTETTGEEQTQTVLRTIRLREADLTVGDEQALSDEEKAALDKLLSTDEGRQALEARYRDMALGASASEKGGQQPQGQQPPARDPRFQGTAPPQQ